MKRVDKQYLKSIEAEKILEVTVKGKNYKLKIERNCHFEENRHPFLIKQKIDYS